MTPPSIVLQVDIAAGAGGRLIAPMGFSTPHAAPIAVNVTGADISIVADPNTAQQAMILVPTDERVNVSWNYVQGGSDYPDHMFKARDSRFTRFADSLADEMRQLTADRHGDGIRVIANHVANMFTYGHPETRFYDDHDEIPQLCSLTEGSCIDINAYFIACCRAAGYEAGYVTGYFIPEEKRTHCTDMHCWVVTRSGEKIQEWDIAHHLKMGLGEIAPGLNPKPGVRVPMAHSMGLNFPAIGLNDIKLLAEPIWLSLDGSWQRADLSITLEGYDLLG